MYDNGRRFEVYIEHLLIESGVKYVKRDILYIRKERWRGLKKKRVAQVDIQVGKRTLISVPSIFELKYSYNSNISMGKDNAVDQLLRAAQITGYKPGGIITNKRYTQGLIEYAGKMGVRLYDSAYLLNLEKKRRSLDGHGLICPSFIGKDLEDRLSIIEKEISGINPRQYKRDQITVYL